MRKINTVRARELEDIINDADRGIISLVGDNGHLSDITASPEPSSLVPGSYVIDTEHGVFYLEGGAEITISEWLPETLGATTVRDEPHWIVSWAISETDATTPLEAARAVWREIFGREVAGADDACVFTVKDTATGEEVSVDLSAFEEG